MSITDAALQAAAQTLLTDLQTNGCSTTADTNVSAFQTAWNASNAGTPLVLSSGQAGADGLYGENTQSALQATLNASGADPPPQAPSGCVAPQAGDANAIQGGGAAFIPGTTTVANPNRMWMLWLVGGIAAAGLTGVYLAKKKNERKISRRQR